MDANGTFVPVKMPDTEKLLGIFLLQPLGIFHSAAACMAMWKILRSLNRYGDR